MPAAITALEIIRDRIFLKFICYTAMLATCIGAILFFLNIVAIRMSNWPLFHTKYGWWIKHIIPRTFRSIITS